MIAKHASDTMTRAPPEILDLVLRAEVSRQLDVSERTLRAWERVGKGPPPIRIGRRVYYRAVTVRRWLLEQEGNISAA